MTNPTIILPILPQTWVRINAGKHGDQVLFKIKEICDKGEDDQPCDEFLQSIQVKRRMGKMVEVGYCKHTLKEAGRQRKRRIERYNTYRTNLYHLAKQVGFQLPTCGMSLYFYIPMSKSWNKKKKAMFHGQMNMSKPDSSNLLKAFEDALSIMDEQVSQMSGHGKFWIDPARVEPHLRQGYIEIKTGGEIYNPFGVELMFTDKTISMMELQERRRIRTENRRVKMEENKKKKKEKPEDPKLLKKVSQKDLFRKEEKIK